MRNLLHIGFREKCLCPASKRRNVFFPFYHFCGPCYFNNSNNKISIVFFPIIKASAKAIRYNNDNCYGAQGEQGRQSWTRGSMSDHEVMDKIPKARGRINKFLIGRAVDVLCMRTFTF